MFSKEQIKKAESCKVRLVCETAYETTFEVSRLVKHRNQIKDEKRTYSVIILNGKGLHLIDRFLGKGCDCRHFTLGTLHGDKLCAHSLAVVKWLDDNGRISKGYYENFVLGKVEP